MYQITFYLLYFRLMTFSFVKNNKVTNTNKILMYLSLVFYFVTNIQYFSFTKYSKLLDKKQLSLKYYQRKNLFYSVSITF